MKSQTLDKPQVLYRHFNKGGELLYVGISSRVQQRTAEHAKHSNWYKQVSRIELEHFPDRLSVSEAEIRAIAYERPRYNKTHILHRYYRESAETPPRKRWLDHWEDDHFITTNEAAANTLLEKRDFLHMSKNDENFPEPARFPGYLKWNVGELRQWLDDPQDNLMQWWDYFHEKNGETDWEVEEC